MGMERRVIYSTMSKLTHVFIGCLVESHQESVKSSQSHNRPECEEANEDFQNSEVRLRNVKNSVGHLMLPPIFVISIISFLPLGTRIMKSQIMCI